MKRQVMFIVLGVFLFQSISCNRDNFVNLQETLVPVDVALVSGFEGREVRVYINDRLCYRQFGEILSRPIPWK